MIVTVITILVWKIILMVSFEGQVRVIRKDTVDYCRNSL